MNLVEGVAALPDPYGLLDLVLAHLDAVLSAPLDDARTAPAERDRSLAEDPGEPLRGALDLDGGAQVKGLQDDGGDGAAVGLVLVVEGDHLQAELKVTALLVVLLLAHLQRDDDVRGPVALLGDVKLRLQRPLGAAGSAAVLANVPRVVDEEHARGGGGAELLHAVDDEAELLRRVLLDADGHAGLRVHDDHGGFEAAHRLDEGVPFVAHRLHRSGQEQDVGHLQPVVLLPGADALADAAGALGDEVDDGALPHVVAVPLHAGADMPGEVDDHEGLHMAGRADDAGERVEVEEVADERLQGGHLVEAGGVEEFREESVSGIPRAAGGAFLLPMEVVVDEGDGAAGFGVGGGGLLDNAPAEVGFGAEVGGLADLDGVVHDVGGNVVGEGGDVGGAARAVGCLALVEGEEHGGGVRGFAVLVQGAERVPDQFVGGLLEVGAIEDRGDVGDLAGVVHAAAEDVPLGVEVFGAVQVRLVARVHVADVLHCAAPQNRVLGCWGGQRCSVTWGCGQAAGWAVPVQRSRGAVWGLRW